MGVSREDDGGGVFISLEEMERKEAEKLAAQEAEQIRQREVETQNAKEHREREIYWAYNLYVLGVGPAIMALWTVLSGPFVHRAGVRCSSQPLGIFVGLTFAIAYVYLFLYSWMLMGPIPFHSRTKPLKVAFGMIAFASVIVYIVGGILMELGGSACLDEAPMQFHYCQIQLVLFIFGFISASIKFAKEFWQRKALEHRRERRKKLKEQLAKEVEVGETDNEDENGGDNEESDEEEEEEDDNVSNNGHSEAVDSEQENIANESELGVGGAGISKDMVNKNEHSSQKTSGAAADEHNNKEGLSKEGLSKDESNLDDKIEHPDQTQ